MNYLQLKSFSKLEKIENAGCELNVESVEKNILNDIEQSIKAKCESAIGIVNAIIALLGKNITKKTKNK